MRLSEKHLKIGLVTVICLLGVAAVFVSHKEDSEGKISETVDAAQTEKANDATQTSVVDGSSVETPNGTVLKTSETTPYNNYGSVVNNEILDGKMKRHEQRMLQVEKNIEQMQEMLDDDERHGEAMEKAISVLADKTSTKKEKLSALQVCEWVGGREAVEAILPELDESDEVGDRANEVMFHLIQENLITGEAMMNENLWFDLITSLPNSQNVNPFMTLLVAYPIEDSAPALLELLKSGDEHIQSISLEYFNHITQGDEINNLDEAKNWFTNYIKRKNENLNVETEEL